MAYDTYFGFPKKLERGEIDITSDTIKLILVSEVETGETVTKYSDITKELSTGYGYTQGGITLLYDSMDLTHAAASSGGGKVTVNFQNASVIVSGGDLGPIGGFIIYDDSHADDILICNYVLSSDITQTDGGTLYLSDICFDVGDDRTGPIIYPKGLEEMLKGNVDLSSDTLKIILATTISTTWDYYSDVTTEVPNGHGYTTGGQTLTSHVFSDNYSAGYVGNNWADAQWTASGGNLPSSGDTASFIIYDDTHADDVLLYGDGFSITHVGDGEYIKIHYLWYDFYL